MRKLIWWVAFVFLVLWLRAEHMKDGPMINAEKDCIGNSIGYDGMQECFKLMDKHKAIRENR